ncbi:hypothetical protein [Aquimarina spongiae]|uniref:Uncharacterized protein n=1 Tax=Aquimarina spongiae TaxID=570521 RepID=A0A1M6IXL5_9FLAO|nr:hypothetical protein [Aquimarina spongiae]SHJ39139.1 hypothetical protein SAMN04488508_108122 [Aquimarina spongiae]
MKTKMKHYIMTVVCCFVVGIMAVKAQIVDNENRLSVTLGDGTAVTLLGKAISLSDAKSKDYYYLPFSLRLATNTENTPEFLFLKYITEEKEAEGGIGGALLHMLMHWGPTPEQQAELEMILKNGEQGAKKGSKLKGALELKPDGEKSLKIISATLGDEKLARSVVQSFNAPVLPGGRAAVASSLTPNGAQLLAATFEKDMAITDLTVELSYKYTTRVPAAKGRVEVRWREMMKHFEKDSAQYRQYRSKKKRGGLFGGLVDGLFGKRSSTDSITYDEVRNVVDEMYKREYIKIDWDDNVKDDRIEKVREAFFDFFLQKMTNSVESQQLAPPTEKEKEAMPDIKYSRKYTYNREFLKTAVKKGRETYYLNLRLAIEKPFTVTANLASWYNGVKNNKKCVSSVLLNDRFFQHRDINFLLDNESKLLFEEGEANYATITVKKERSSGNDFNDNVIIDYDYMKNKGLKTVISYARGDDENTDNYKYSAQWSLKGGNKFPAEPEWVEGDWMHNDITLAPPIVPRTIEFESDLEELKALGVVRATLQLRYMKFGNETESNIPITVSKGEPLVERTIFTDRDTQGYAYRYILTHKERGKMVLDWETKINDDYVYATIPQELKDEDPDYLEKIISAGEVLLKPGKDGKVSKTAKILDRFKDVLKVVKTDSK